MFYFQLTHSELSLLLDFVSRLLASCGKLRVVVALRQAVGFVSNFTPAVLSVSQLSLITCARLIIYSCMQPSTLFVVSHIFNPNCFYNLVIITGPRILAQNELRVCGAEFGTAGVASL